jgi:Arm DNA-binding domain
MNRTLFLSDSNIAKLPKPAAGTSYIVHDSIIRGFLLKVSSGAKTGVVRKTYLLRTRYPDGVRLDKREKKDDGSVDANTVHAVRRELGQHGRINAVVARDKAKLWLQLFEKGISPREQERIEKQNHQRARAATVKKMVEAWLDGVACKRRRYKRYVRDCETLVTRILATTRSLVSQGRESATG